MHQVSRRTGATCAPMRRRGREQHAHALPHEPGTGLPTPHRIRNRWPSTSTCAAGRVCSGAISLQPASCQSWRSTPGPVIGIAVVTASRVPESDSTVAGDASVLRPASRSRAPSSPSCSAALIRSSTSVARTRPRLTSTATTRTASPATGSNRHADRPNRTSVPSPSRIQPMASATSYRAISPSTGVAGGAIAGPSSPEVLRNGGLPRKRSQNGILAI
jgi:hypothetical protein